MKLMCFRVYEICNYFIWFYESFNLSKIIFVGFLLSSHCYNIESDINLYIAVMLFYKSKQGGILITLHFDIIFSKKKIV